MVGWQSERTGVCGVHSLRGDVQGATGRHGVARVGREVEQRLLKLTDVAMHCAHVVAQLGCQFDVCAKDAREESIK